MDDASQCSSFQRSVSEANQHSANDFETYLAAEFRSYSRALRKNLEANDPEDDHLSVGKINRLFSEDLAAELGLLELGEIDVVVNALISLEGMDQYLGHISAGQTEKRYLVTASAMDDFRMITSTTADALDNAIEVLELSGDTYTDL